MLSIDLNDEIIFSLGLPDSTSNGPFDGKEARFMIHKHERSGTKGSEQLALLSLSTSGVLLSVSLFGVEPTSTQNS